MGRRPTKLSLSQHQRAELRACLQGDAPEAIQDRIRVILRAAEGTHSLDDLAQDFGAAFGLGADDRHISVIDGAGVALAAIQGLNDVVKEKDTRIERLERDVAELKQLVRNLARGRTEVVK